MLVVDSQVHAWSNGESTGHHRRLPITHEVLKAGMARAGVDPMRRSAGYSMPSAPSG